MKRSSVIPAVFGAALLVAGLASPAVAQTVVRDDARDDAPARIDISRVKYSHGTNRIRAVAKIPDLGRSGTADLLVTRHGLFDAGYVVRIRQPKTGPARLSLRYFDHFDMTKRECAGLAGAWGPRKVVISVPRSCLTGHATNRVRAQFWIAYGAQGDLFDAAPAVKRLRRS